MSIQGQSGGTEVQSQARVHAEDESGVHLTSRDAQMKELGGQGFQIRRGRGEERRGEERRGIYLHRLIYGGAGPEMERDEAMEEEEEEEEEEDEEREREMKRWRREREREMGQ